MTQFSNPQPLLDLVAAQKRGQPEGIYSVCSAQQFVLEAGMHQAAADGSRLLIEATCNQVNQFGGYTGMTPADFSAYVATIAAAVNFPVENILLGGDHLGIHPWQSEAADVAMAKASDMVKAFVQAGFRKIHLDTSMAAASDDPHTALPPEVIAERAARLCVAAESARQDHQSLVYVVGTEVPPPGGAHAEDAGLQLTTPQDARRSIEIFQQAFRQHGLDSAWENTIALVVQPGVEFGNTEIHDYRPEKAVQLSRMIESVPGMVFEAHSTDYQRPQALRRLVEDHFAILKVGPELTFAFREAVFALAAIEKEYLAQRAGVRLSGIVETIEQVMLQKPKDWEKYYPGSPAEQSYARKYSLSDRIRYYWPQPPIQAGLAQLFENLTRFPPPLALLSQYLPREYDAVRDGALRNRPQELVRAHIQEIARKYSAACRAA